MSGIFQAIFPHPIPFRTLEELAARPEDDGRITKTMYERALSGFTRVCEGMGVLDQPKSQKEGSRDE